MGELLAPRRTARPRLAIRPGSEAAFASVALSLHQTPLWAPTGDGGGAVRQEPWQGSEIQEKFTGCRVCGGPSCELCGSPLLIDSSPAGNRPHMQQRQPQGPLWFPLWGSGHLAVGQRDRRSRGGQRPQKVLPSPEDGGPTSQVHGELPVPQDCAKLPRGGRRGSLPWRSALVLSDATRHLL
ncbi:hypothetical protein AGIG_G13841 [Arapaima gigas]